MQDKYFSLQGGGGLQAAETRREAGTKLDLVWLEDGAVAFKAENGKMIGTKKSGHLFANVDGVEDRSKYYFYLINRPILVLKCEQGFVGYRAAGTPKLECNKANYATIQVERAEQGQVYFKGQFPPISFPFSSETVTPGQNDKYWQVSEGGISCDSEVPHGFFLELREPTRMCIKTAGGQYLVEQKNGGLAVGGTDPEDATR